MTTPTCWIPACEATPGVQWRRRADGDDIEAVFACPPHAITLDAATHVHQPSCTPDPARLPLCGCVPEPLPAEPPPAQDTVTLPTGWTIPTT